MHELQLKWNDYNIVKLYCPKLQNNSKIKVNNTKWYYNYGNKVSF